MDFEEIRQALLDLDALRAHQGTAFSRWFAGTAQQDAKAYQQAKHHLEECLPGFEIFWIEDLYRAGHVLMPLPAAPKDEQAQQAEQEMYQALGGCFLPMGTEGGKDGA